MTCGRLASLLPRPLHRYALDFDARIDDAVSQFAQRQTTGALVLDAGAGESRHAKLFERQRYCGVDLAVGDTDWNYSRLHAIADLAQLPFADASFDAALNIVTLEHLPEPAAALRELGRVLKAGGTLLLVAPHEWEVHQAPHDFFRYTRHGLDYLLRSAGFEVSSIIPAGGYFRLLSRRLLGGLQFFMGGWRWLLFLPAAVLFVPAALILPLLDPLDQEQNFTLGYVCLATRLE